MEIAVINAESKILKLLTSSNDGRDYPVLIYTVSS